jgi:hypothetical protein
MSMHTALVKLRRSFTQALRTKYFCSWLAPTRTYDKIRYRVSNLWVYAPKQFKYGNRICISACSSSSPVECLLQAELKASFLQTSVCALRKQTVPSFAAMTLVESSAVVHGQGWHPHIQRRSQSTRRVSGAPTGAGLSRRSTANHTPEHKH